MAGQLTPDDLRDMLRTILADSREQALRDIRYHGSVGVLSAGEHAAYGGHGHAQLLADMCRMLEQLVTECHSMAIDDGEEPIARVLAVRMICRVATAFGLPWDATTINITKPDM